VFDTVADAVRETEANTSVIYVPAAVAASAVFEAADAGIRSSCASRRASRCWT